MCEAVLQQMVTVRFDPGAPRRGGYGRLLAYVEFEGQDLSLLQLERGLAESRREPHQRKQAYEQAEARARKAQRGIWSGK